MDQSINSHRSQSRKFTEWVEYTGTDALKEGEGVCYDSDYGTATKADARRANNVERPSLANNRNFAGVAARCYSAQAGGQLIEINNPGSVCLIALGANTVLNTGMLTCQAGGAAGRFSDKGFPGRGSAIPKQTVTAAVLESVKDGTGSLLATDGKTLTVSDSSDMAVGDTVVMLGGEDDATGALVPGKYAIGSITGATTIVLATCALDVVSTGAITCSYYIYNGNPKCLAYLMDGEESGLVDWLSPANAGNAGITHMVGGITYINGGIDIAADVDADLAEETIYGSKKAFVLMGDLTTSDFTVDLVTAGLQRDGATSLAEILTMDDATDACYLVWNGQWQCTTILVGATEG